MTDEIRRVEQALATRSPLLRPAPDWKDAVWNEIRAAEHLAPLELPVFVLPTLRAEVEANPPTSARLFLVAPPDREAAAVNEAPAARRPVMAPFVAASAAFAMAAVMMLVIVSQSQTAAAEKQLRIAVTEIAELHDEIDQKLYEIDVAHERGRAAFRQLWYSKDDGAGQSNEHRPAAAPTQRVERAQKQSYQRTTDLRPGACAGDRLCTH